MSIHLPPPFTLGHPAGGSAFGDIRLSLPPGPLPLDHLEGVHRSLCHTVPPSVLTLTHPALHGICSGHAECLAPQCPSRSQCSESLCWLAGVSVSQLVNFLRIGGESENIQWAIHPQGLENKVAWVPSQQGNTLSWVLSNLFF